MQPEQQQRILGYFIEEARDHLNTIEQGLLNLQSTLQDSEMVNEIFRAAHSIKGGAAMLGLNSIQRTAHRFEDFFKVLKECQSVQIDQTIESLFLRMFDNLQALLDQLQSESGLTEDVANRLMSEVEPVFATLEKHLELRVNQAGGTMQLEESFATPTLTHAPVTRSPVSVFENSVPETLRQMLQLFKQPETAQTRQQLEQLCNQLAQLGKQFNLSGWCTLCETAAGAIANSDNTYRTLAPIVIKEIKQAQQLVLAERGDEITTGEQLQALSLKTFLSDWEDTSTSIEPEDKQLTDIIGVAQQQPTELFSIKPNSVESELLADFSQLSTPEQITDWAAEDNLSSLFALNSNNNNQCLDLASSDDLNIENDEDCSPSKLSKDNLSLISSEETSALNSLFDEAQDTSLDLDTAEPAFCDLFKAPEADVESFDLLDSTAASTLNSNFSSLWASPDAPTGSEFDKEEFYEPVVSSEANNDVDNHIDFALSNSSEVTQQFEQHWLVESEIDLNTVLKSTLSSDSNQLFDVAVNATPTPAPENTTDLELSLTHSVSDLFSSDIVETQSSLDLFEASDKTASQQLDFSLDHSTDLFVPLESQSGLELFEQPTENRSEQLDFSLDTLETQSSLELFSAPDNTPSQELDFNLEGSQSESSLDLFDQPTENRSEQLDFSLDTLETQSSLELFSAPDNTPSQELDFSLESSQTESSLDLFDASDNTPSQELDFSLESSQTESSLDLFVAPTENAAEQLDFSLDTPETQSGLDLFDASDNTPSEELNFSLEGSQSESSLALFALPTENPSEQLDFSLDTPETQSSLDLFDASDNTPSEELDFSLESSQTESSLDLFDASDNTPSQELDFSLESSQTESSLDLFDPPTENPTEQLDFSLDTPETQSGLDLFVASDNTPSEELDFSLESSQTESGLDLFDPPTENPSEQLDFSFNTPETQSSLDLFDPPDNTPSQELNFSLEGSQTESSLNLFDASDNTPSQELDFSLESSQTESGLDLFDPPTENPSEQLDFSLEGSQTESGLDLFVASDNTPSQELDFSLESSQTESSLDLFDASDNTPSQELDFSLESSQTESGLDLFVAPMENPSEQLDFSLESSQTESSLDLFDASDNTSSQELDFSLESSQTESGLDLFDPPTENPSEQLDFTLDTPETQSSLDLFDPPDNTPSQELDFSLESSQTESSLDLFDPPTENLSEQLDFSLEGSQTESGLDLFVAPTENPSEQLDFSLESSQTESGLDLFVASDNTPSQELDFSLESSQTESGLNLFDPPTENPSEQLDFSLESSQTESSLDLFDASDNTLSQELDFSLESSQTESGLDLFDPPTENLSEQLDFSLEGSQTEPSLNLFDASDNTLSQELDFSFDTQETQSSLNLFDAPDNTPCVENAQSDQLMVEFDLIDSIEVTLEDQSNNRVEMGVEEMPSHTQYLDEDSTASVVSDLEVQAELPDAIATESVADDFAELEALLEEESTSCVVATSAQLDLNTPIAPVATAPPSSNDEFDDLDKLLEETPTKPATPEPAKPPQKPAATNSRRSAFEQMMRVPVKQLDSISNQVGELVVYRNSLEQDQERLRQFLDNLLHQVQQLGDVGSRMQELYERSLVEASLISHRQGSHLALIDTAPESKAHVTGISFDALEMDRFTGFHTLAQEMIELIVRVREASSDIEFVTGETEQVARQFRQVTTQLQEGITRSRMVPFSQIAERLPRAVRDISLKYGKQAELAIEGKDTLIDKVILEQLYDPMTHLVNNAITHGIESSEERSKNGKSPVGQITIRAFHQGNQTVITVSDDGAGIDPERVKAKAIKNGLITPEAANNMSRLDVYNLLFHAGFSTKEAVDEFAGRGVGMDVVLTSLSQIRGTITTDSALGKGTTFTIRLPLTLSICKALCCLSDKARVAFPMDGVEQMIDIPQESVVTNAEGQTCIPWHDSLLPFRHLREFLSFNRQISRGNIYGSSRDDNMISVIVLRSADMFFAIQVDQVLGEQEIVIKQFEGPAPKPVGIAGATILGDGRIMPIADVLELIDLSMGRIRHQGEGAWWTANDASLPPENTSEMRTEPMVLIVDDSITVRELLSMTFVNAGYRVEQARDGQEAWDKLRDGLPCDLIFCDIEMPKMDGLELLSRMQQDAKLSQIPISMLTSRGSARHRQMALQLGASGYFTKPYLEEALLDGAQRMLKGEVLLTPSISSV